MEMRRRIHFEGQSEYKQKQRQEMLGKLPARPLRVVRMAVD